MNFSDALVRSIKAKESALCVGLDPQLGKLPKFLVERMVKEYGETMEAAAEAFIAFNKGIIDAVKDLVPSVKPQLAYYEEFGHQGIRAFEETCAYAKQAGLLVIADGKRNDIGSTAEAYARAFFEPNLFGKPQETSVDALTVNGYLGVDGISPFLKACAKDKGIFVLVRTSNPSSGDIQDRITADEQMSMAELMGHFVESWGSDFEGEEGYSSVGAVVGATHPVQAERLREILPKNFFLVPGYGTQGGTAADIAACFNKDGLGALIVNARGIIYAFAEEGGLANGENFAEAARNATLKMKEDVNRVR